MTNILLSFKNMKFQKKKFPFIKTKIFPKIFLKIKTKKNWFSFSEHPPCPPCSVPETVGCPWPTRPSATVWCARSRSNPPRKLLRGPPLFPEDCWRRRDCCCWLCRGRQRRTGIGHRCPGWRTGSGHSSRGWPGSGKCENYAQNFIKIFLNRKSKISQKFSPSITLKNSKF